MTSRFAVCRDAAAHRSWAHSTRRFTRCRDDVSRRIFRSGRLLMLVALSHAAIAGEPAVRVNEPAVHINEPAVPGGKTTANLSAPGTNDYPPCGAVPLFSRGGPEIALMWSDGRLVANPPCHRTGSAEEVQGPVRVHVSVSARNGLPTLQVNYQSDRIAHQIAVIDAFRVTWDANDSLTGLRVRLEQPVSGDLKWTVQQSGNVTTVEARNWLHLKLIGGDVFARMIEPILEQLTPQRTLRQLEFSTESAMRDRLALFQPSGSRHGRIDEVQHADVEANRAAVFELVVSLNAPTRGERRSARRRLQEMGIAAVAHLQTMDSTDWTPHQRREIQMLLGRFEVNRMDAPGQLAARMIPDKKYWQDRMAVQGPRLASVPVFRTHLRSLGIETDPVLPSESAVATQPAVATEPVVRVANR